MLEGVTSKRSEKSASAEVARDGEGDGLSPP
jgi:hypothetical protein